MGFNLMSAVGGFAENRSEHLKEKRENNQRMMEKQYDTFADDLKDMRAKRRTRADQFKAANDSLAGMGVNPDNRRLIMSGGLGNSQQVIANLQTHINKHSNDAPGDTTPWNINTLFSGRDTSKLGTMDDIRESAVGTVSGTFDRKAKAKTPFMNRMFGSTTADVIDRGSATTTYGTKGGSGNGFVSNYDDWLKQQETIAKTKKYNIGDTAEGRYTDTDATLANIFQGGWGGTLRDGPNGVSIAFDKDHNQDAIYVNTALGALRDEVRVLVDKNGMTPEAAGSYIYGLIHTKDTEKLDEILGNRVKGLKWQDFKNKTTGGTGTPDPNKKSPPNPAPLKATDPKVKSMLQKYKNMKGGNKSKYGQSIVQSLIDGGTMTPAEARALVAKYR